MFATSATYHIPQWGPAARNVLRRLDHSAIFVLIAGTNTPLAMLGLDASSRSRLLGIVWAGAAAGVLQTLFFRHAPKALAASLYVALGWAALPYAGQLSAALGSAGVALVVGGGVVYSLGVRTNARLSARLCLRARAGLRACAAPVALPPSAAPAGWLAPAGCPIRASRRLPGAP